MPLTEPTDLDTYLRYYEAGGYPVHRVEHATCAVCADPTAGFTVALDDAEGVAVRRCVRCHGEVVMLDSMDALEDAELGEATCPCGHAEFDVAVGFSLRPAGDEVRWVSVALRCRGDGFIGVYTDWKIDYSPSGHLLGAV